MLPSTHFMSRQEWSYLLIFYLVIAMLYYLSTWQYWGGFADKGHPPIYSLTEFFASSGINFIIKFFFTLPIIFLFFIKFAAFPLPKLLWVHLLTLPLFVLFSNFFQERVIRFFGYAQVFGGRADVWNYYNSVLFYLLQFGLIHAYDFHRKYKTELELKQVLKEVALQSELTALKAQLNPHFINNTFNTINASVADNKEKTRELIIQLSDMFRYQNKASKREVVTLGEELNFIKKYLDLEKQRLEERLQYNIEVSPDLLSKKIPPMLLQPLVENAVTHGLAASVKGGEISIHIKEQSGKTEFIISDTGVGVSSFETLFGKGLGLTNIRLRLNKIYHTDLILEHHQPSGLIIKFSI